MKKTSIVALMGAAVFVALAMLIITFGFYGSFGPLSLRSSVTLWVLAGVCSYCTWMIRDRKKDRGIGQDSSQLNPLTAANFLIIGKASAWTGAIIGGAYSGIAMYVLPKASVLTAAAADIPAVLFGLSGGIALSAAGIILERNCETPPPSEGTPA